MVNTDAVARIMVRARAKAARVKAADMVKAARARVKAMDMDKVAKASVAREAAVVKGAMDTRARADKAATAAMAISNAAIIRRRGISPALQQTLLHRPCQASMCRVKNHFWRSLPPMLHR